ncbi:hypothetical protein AgCh_031416 [Apium graveolens]
MLCSWGPEIRTSFLKDGKPIQLKEGREITLSTDYSIKADEETISMSYKKLPVDINPGNTILCADGTITLTVLSCDTTAVTVRCRCENTSMLGIEMKMAKRFEGKVVIVSASTQGIGFGIAERLALECASVVISSRKQIFSVV